MDTYDIILSSHHQATYDKSTKRGKSLINNITSELISDSHLDLSTLGPSVDVTITNTLAESSDTYHKYVLGHPGSDVVARQMVERSMDQIKLASVKKAKGRKRNNKPLFGVSSYHSQVSRNTLTTQQRVDVDQMTRYDQPAVGQGSTSVAVPRSQLQLPQSQVHNPFGHAGSYSTPQSQGVIPLSEYDSNFSTMNYMNIRPMRDYTETYNSCDTATQAWLENLSRRMSKFDYPTLVAFANDEKVFRQGLHSIFSERSTIIQELYGDTGVGSYSNGKVLMSQILSRAKEFRAYEDQQRSYYQQRQQGYGGFASTSEERSNDETSTADHTGRLYDPVRDRHL
ncbi:hypothetical protein L486_04617 [Kwoniella mangroviensis CBS 10435]|uniref:Uncharacterized protein n=1 Tax=Kwoniella mangroviensis CBS 10435 TaxID=1331196 RepID=A0A1B9INK8_9TREE|nr:hypothetical protein L486_04617 [Kwoniella mangroviensis CBS 10435]